jgi:hypothetical protein
MAGWMFISEVAEADCGDFGGLGVVLVAAAAGGAAITGGIVAPAVIVLSDDSKDYPYPRNALLSVGAGGLVTLLYTIVDLSTDCVIFDDLGGAGLIAVPATTLGVSVLTAVLLWVYADDWEEPPIALGFVPREGGGTAALSFSF